MAMLFMSVATSSILPWLQEQKRDQLNPLIFDVEDVSYSCWHSQNDLRSTLHIHPLSNEEQKTTLSFEIQNGVVVMDEISDHKNPKNLKDLFPGIAPDEAENLEMILSSLYQLIPSKPAKEVNEEQPFKLSKHDKFLDIIACTPKYIWAEFIKSEMITCNLKGRVVLSSFFEQQTNRIHVTQYIWPETQLKLSIEFDPLKNPIALLKNDQPIEEGTQVDEESVLLPYNLFFFKMADSIFEMLQTKKHFKDCPFFLTMGHTYNTSYYAWNFQNRLNIQPVADFDAGSENAISYFQLTKENTVIQIHAYHASDAVEKKVLYTLYTKLKS
jgi:hypothetical protein